MRLFKLSLLSMLLVLGVAGSSQAGWWEKVWNRTKTDFHRNNQWPNTFVYADREAANAPFAIMTQKGWRAQNTLGSYYFEVGTSDLNEAGRLRVDWIMTQAPPQFRMVFVERAQTKDLTEARMAAIRNYSATSPDGGELAVHETGIPSRSWPAEDIYRTYTQFQDSRPAPVLPASTGDTGGGQ
ncbi:MAG: hypothetical protein AB7O62_10675 [Pirellulales bacterium]